MLGLVFLKNGGYLLYKGYDRPYLQGLNIKNSITFFSEKKIFAVSLTFFLLSILCFVATCINSTYGKIAFLGSLPFAFLWFSIFFVVPIAVQYLLFFKMVRIEARYVRGFGFSLLLLLIVGILIIW